MRLRWQWGGWERELEKKRELYKGKELKAYLLQVPFHIWEIWDLMRWINSPLVILGDMKLSKWEDRLETETAYGWLKAWPEWLVLFQVKCGRSRGQIFLETPVHVLTLAAFSWQDAATPSCWLFLNSLGQGVQGLQTHKKWGTFSCRDGGLPTEQTAPHPPPMASSLPL